MDVLIVLICVIIPILAIGFAINNYFKDEDKPIETDNKHKENGENKIINNQSTMEEKKSRQEFLFDEPCVENLLNIILEYLTNEGFRPLRNNLSILFKSEGTWIYVNFSENDPNHFCVESYFSYEKDDYNEILHIINEFIPRFKLAKAFITEQDTVISADTLIYGMHNVIPAFSRIFDLHKRVLEEFRNELSAHFFQNLN